MLFSYTKDILPHPPHSPLPPSHNRDATARANTAAGYITAGYITDPDAHGDLLANSIYHWSIGSPRMAVGGPCNDHGPFRET